MARLSAVHQGIGEGPPLRPPPPPPPVGAPGAGVGQVPLQCMMLAIQVLTLKTCRHCAGVKLASGEDVAAALVIDATGGRSHAITQFLENKCGQKVEVVKHSVALSYYTRFFKIPDKVSCTLDSSCFLPAGGFF